MAAQNHANPDDYVKKLCVVTQPFFQSVRAIYEDKVVDSIAFNEGKAKDRKVSLAELDKAYDEILMQDAPSRLSAQKDVLMIMDIQIKSCG